MPQDELVTKYEIEIARLDELDAHLDSLWKVVPRYGYVGLLAPVVWYFYGFGWAVAELLVTISLVATQGYLIRMRKSENRWNRQRLVQDLESRRAELGQRS